MKALLMMLPLMLLGACDSNPEVKIDNAKPSEVAAKVREAGGGGEFVRPGKWVSTVTIQEMNIPGMPPEFAAKIKERMTQGRTVESCLTPEQAKKPKEDFFAGVDKSCRYEHFEMDGGKIDAAMTCTHDKMVQKMTMAGSYSPERYNMTMTNKMEGGGPQSGTTMKMTVEARRAGDCDAKSAAEG
ncbi:MAG: DUF3617 domain-containing protein [Sphingomicrobium sp.]